MLHRPNFCCSCGEKIDRIEWHVWTSRRFCELCQTDYQLDDWLPRILGGFCILLGVFGFGSWLSAGRQQAELIRSPAALALKRARSIELKPVHRPSVEPAPKSIETPLTVRPEPPPSNASVTPASIDEATYICGARTRKGTACTRRVKGGGRCWQHKGMDAMLPDEKLIVETGH